jgi:hypothetical protein
MSKRLIWLAVIGAGLASVIATSAFAKPEVVRVGDLVLTDNGGISPTTLPRHGQAPISARIEGKIGTTDGSHPPAVKTVIADIDKTIQLNTRGLPTCPEGRLEAQPTAAARQACPEAIVGTGEGEVEVAFPEQMPFSAKGKLLIFNGGTQGGATRLFIHTYVSVPTPTAVIATVTLTRIHRGHFGMHAVAQIPVIAGGAGSVTMFKFNIGRSFTYKGTQEHYLTAGCPTGHWYTEGHIEFDGGTTLKVFHAFPCTPIG